jgi:hypothetical protein
VDEQVVLPGHCLSDLVGIDSGDREAIASVRGLGAKRLARYRSTLQLLLEGDLPAEPEPTAAEIEP